MVEIDEAESTLSELNAKLKEESKEVTGKRNRKSTSTNGKASERQVAKAVGEKPKLSKEQEEAKKLARKLQKEKEAKQKEVEKCNDLALFAKRSSQRQNKSLEHLVPGKYETPSSAVLRPSGSQLFPDKSIASTSSNVVNQNDVGPVLVCSNAADSVIIRNHSDSDDMSSEDDVTFGSHPKVSLGLSAETAESFCQDNDPSLVNTILDLSKYSLPYSSLCPTSLL